MSLILSTTAGKSHLIHLVDTPGHVNFMDEVPLAIRLVDGILLVVDVIEGFTRKAADAGQGHSFVQFILEPLYKLYSLMLNKETEPLRETLAGSGIKLKPVMYRMDLRPLLKAGLFGPATGLVDVIVEHIPSSIDGVINKIQGHIYRPTNTYNPSVPLDGFSPEDEEDMVKSIVADLLISEARYLILTDETPAGNLVLIGGVDASMSKTATLSAAADYADDLYIFCPIKHMTESVKTAIEPIDPSELPKMRSVLRSINRSYSRQR
ncbi:hypothetical protein F5051DRAFT_444316 [Lentinula edodes]|nr:hypothetical protein F5051DRAFT_444316 [Lentinula edodes]